MYVSSETTSQTYQETAKYLKPEELQEQLIELTEWKSKAKVQLEYFRYACRLYNLCDSNEVNQLLNDKCASIRFWLDVLNLTASRWKVQNKAACKFRH